MTRHPFLHLIAALMLLVTVLGVYGYWYSVVSAESAKANDLATQIQIKSQDTTRIAKAKSELASLSSDEAAINKYFVSTDNIVPFLEGLQATGKYLGASVNVVSVSATPGTPYGHLTLSLNISGSFDSVVRTLGAIEYGPYDTALNTLTIDSTQSTTGVRTWNAAAVFSVGTQNKTP